MNNIASIAISNTTRKFDKDYHYIIPDKYIGSIVPGMRVIVPFGKSNRLVEGYVLDVLESPEVSSLKEISRVIDEKPVLKENMIRLACWMKRQYICTYYDTIKCMLPPGTGVSSTKVVRLKKCEGGFKGNIKKIIDVLAECGGEMEYEELKKQVNTKTFAKYINNLKEQGCIEVHEEFTSKVKEKYVRAVYLAKPWEEVVYDIETNKIKNIKHIRILELLAENEYIPVGDIVRFVGVSAGVLDTLKKKGYLEFEDIEVTRDPAANMPYERTLPMKPTQEQQVVIDRVKSMLDSGEFNEVLLHGITGSGKTEVYLQLIGHCISMGKQAIVLVPEISLTPQMVNRFKGRFGEDVAVMHSRLSLGERYDQWRLVRDGRTKVVVGARSAVFAPFDNLGLVIIDEEHESSYKSEIVPKYHAAEIARQRCIMENAVLLYGSATPSVETYYRAKTGEIELLEMTKRANNMLLPEVKVVDMRNELNAGNRSVFSRCLQNEIRKNIDSGQQTIVFLNRRGYATFILCRNCGYVLKCPYCDVSLTYHSHEERVICHYCGFTVKNPEHCPKCKSNHIRNFGTGTQKIEEEVKKQFEGCTVIRMDLDTTTGKNSHEEILRKFRDDNINVMVGTQMIAKGHDFPNVTLVGVLAADSILNTGDYKAAERTFQLLTQVAGRAGRGTIPGRVIIQTYNTDNYSIVCACEQDYVSFYNNEILVRKNLQYPPFIHLASVILSGVNDKQVLNRALFVKNELCRHFKDNGSTAQILGPLRAPLAKIKNKYRWRIVIKCEESDKLIDVLTKVSDGYYSKSAKNSVALSVDINPVNML
ncbi:MAG TPA: primosomal protein N' [Hungateiclostridium thermocellum]|jgi:primosomal protein N' (replication factor Y)|uniref:Replication restart protein PriA n=2 Tax=Acetivibrio thermocellus TaxID=1515 RepID=A3DCX3_ACET2|nr:primosomal protein N' [Acetivibrio thermocellus]CDG35259.1 Primosomal protein N' [Acetivibrio thermocellus BC1]ABN51802.1 primosomal protein N' [Acetivibrio thermocellus ATCC 27405]ADU74728.1 primosomal protein N' [Acetivibrio thermocellus DSM 1313]ALX08679.1 primosomal protein N [Acetivibrio thermocellus AD2]ANV76431.1 primosomal protein N [Acetivibrio thermocellus DSM 2360]